MRQQLIGVEFRIVRRQPSADRGVLICPPERSDTCFDDRLASDRAHAVSRNSRGGGR
jgi:hypothetical protein